MIATIEIIGLFYACHTTLTLLRDITTPAFSKLLLSPKPPQDTSARALRHWGIPLNSSRLQAYFAKL